MRVKALALLLLLGVAAFAVPARAEVEDEADDEYADVDAKAFLLVRQKIDTDQLQVHKPVTVRIEVHNAGKADAKKVTVTEGQWPDRDFVTEGKTEAEFDTIPAGTTESFTYTLIARNYGYQYLAPITLATYIAEAAGTLVTTRSPELEVEVYSANDILKAKVLHYAGVATFGLLKEGKDWLRFIVILAGVAVALTLLRGYGAVQKSRSERKRRQALKDLGVEDLKTQ